ncbi:MAG: hypothetical protein VB875_12510 [Pirellulales bacterium]
MDTQYHEELISAYLDGELTGDELRTVERLLAESEEARQLFNELRSLQGGLRSLPKHSLGEEFSQAVLRRTERAVLPGRDADRGLAGPSKPESTNAPSPFAVRDAADRSAALKRRVTWSVLAVAAAVLIMIFGPTTTENRQTASHDDERKDAAGSPSANSDARIGADTDSPDDAALDSAVEESEEFAGAAAGKLPAADRPAEINRGPGSPIKETDKSIVSTPSYERPAVRDAAAKNRRRKIASAAPNFLTDNDGIAIFISVDRLPRNGALRNLGLIEAGNDLLARSSVAQNNSNEKSKNDAKNVAKLETSRIESLAKGNGGQQLTYAIVEGTRDEVNSMLAKLQAGSVSSAAINMNPQLAMFTPARSAGGGEGGGSNAGAVDPFAQPVLDEDAAAPAAEQKKSVFRESRDRVEADDDAKAEKPPQAKPRAREQFARPADISAAKSFADRVADVIVTRAQQQRSLQRQTAADHPDPAEPLPDTLLEKLADASEIKRNGREEQASAAVPAAGKPIPKAGTGPAAAGAKIKDQPRLGGARIKTYRVLVVLGVKPAAAPAADPPK